MYRRGPYATMPKIDARQRRQSQISSATDRRNTVVAAFTSGRSPPWTTITGGPNPKRYTKPGTSPELKFWKKLFRIK